ALAEAYKSLDKAVTKKIIHRNKAAKRKSRLSKLLKKATPKTSS
ncbi:MAG: 30S ribosomal protein S20, partial [Candidatus Omnitrophica bacterium]|nr:30S ribosomal protein S20 [Candidatus Omnitrophota bacterium]